MPARREKARIVLLVLVMAVVSMAVLGTAIFMMYRTALNEEREVLVSIVQSQARLLEVMVKSSAKFEPDYPGGPEKATLDRFVQAHQSFGGIGSTGEFTLARREGDTIVFLLNHRYFDFTRPHPVSMKSGIAEPMRRALSGESGTIIGPDYRGEQVLAAYEPVAGTDWGIVAKVDLSEIRDPFLRGGVFILLFAAVFILLGKFMFVWIANPIIRRIEGDAQKLKDLVESLHQSEGDLQKANDELEIRVKQRTAELASTNDSLEIEVTQRAQAEERLRALWKTAELINAEDRELCDHILEGALQITSSQYALYGFLSPDERVMSIYSWSKDALDECNSLEYPVEFSVAEGGIWAEAIRQRQVIVVNDYNVENRGKKGLPVGHVPLTRLLIVPVFIRDSVVAIVITANKETDYTPDDVKQLEAFARGVQLILNQRKIEEALRKSEKECRLLSRRVIETQEQERKRFAREIHDGIGQSLVALKFRAENYSMMPDGERVAKEREWKSTIRMIQDTMEEVRRIQNDLRPAYLDELGVVEALEDFCEIFQAAYPNVKAVMLANIAEEDVPEFLKAPIFRISQEAMNNAGKHSGAMIVSLCIQRTEDEIKLTIKDDGVGFERNHGRSAPGTSMGLGLYTMRERAKLSSGNLEIVSAPGQGTSIQATWSVENGETTMRL